MNTVILISLLCLVCSPPGSLGSAVTFSPGLGRPSGVVTSGEVLRMTREEPDLEEDVSGTQAEESTPDSAPQISEEEKRLKRKGKGKKRNKHKSRHTTAFQPDTSFTSSLTSNNTSAHTAHTAHTSAIVTADPCSSSHLTYCIHGMCKYLEDLNEAVCVCMKGFDGERCGIQLLLSRHEEEGSRGEMVQTALVIIAVVLSLMSCIAILLMTCAHYRTHKNFLSAYLGSVSEKHQLQTTPADVTV